jgi:hypothetical protein
LIGKIFRFLPFFPYWSFIFNTESNNDHNLHANISNENSEVFTFKNLCLISLIVQTIVYPFVFYYLKHVIKNEQDNSQHWLFFLRKKSKRRGRTVDDTLIKQYTSNINIRSLLKKKANRIISCKIVI